MTLTAFKRLVASQFHATLTLLESAIINCPARRWRDPVGTWPFWLVAYHVLCYVDVYSSRSNRAWRPHPRFHPKGRAELREEFPSREFTREELLEYASFCREKFDAALSGETAKSLACSSGFSWAKFTRGELYVYNLRHLALHGGQLSAFLRRIGATTKGRGEGMAVPWVMAEPPSGKR